MSIVYSIQSGENFKKVFTAIKTNNIKYLNCYTRFVEGVSE